MTSCILFFALFLMWTPLSYARAVCSEGNAISQAECEANILLDQGIALFQKKDYADAQKDFQRIIQSYPQSKDAVARASFYNAECDRLRIKPTTSIRVLKFKRETAHGQILLPGQKPPDSTLQESQKDLLPGSTNGVPPVR